MTDALPETLTLDGRVIADQSSGNARTAAAAGIIVDVHVTSGSFAKKGEVILTITGPDYIDAQNALIDAHQGKFKTKPTSLKNMSQMVAATYSPLRALKFSDQQIREITGSKLPYNPVPILMPQDGIVMHSAEPARAFDIGAALFDFFPNTLISARIKDGFAEYLRPNKSVFMQISGNGAHIGAVQSMASGAQDGTRDVLIKIAGKVLAVGDMVACTFKFDAWERFDPKATRDMWPYPNLPRGADRDGVLRKLGLLVEPRALHTGMSSAKTPAVHANPFDGTARPRTREPQSDPAPQNPRLTAPPNPGLARPSLALGDRKFCTWAISTCPAKRETVVPQWRCTAQVLVLPAGDEIVTINSSGTGIFEPIARRRGDPIRAGTAIGFMVSHSSEHTAVVQRVGKTGVAAADTTVVRQTRMPVLVERDGVLLESLGEERSVQQGETLVQLRAVNMYLLQTQLPVHDFEQLPPVIETRVAKVGLNTSPLYVNDTALIIERSRGDGFVKFDISHPAEAGQFKNGYGKEVGLFDRTDPRTSICIPADCIVRVGRSIEVLVHSKVGKLTPTTVKCGGRYGDFVEIIAGLSEGNFVVRDLEALCSEQRDIRAIMSGFWDPQKR